MSNISDTSSPLLILLLINSITLSRLRVKFVFLTLSPPYGGLVIIYLYLCSNVSLKASLYLKLSSTGNSPVKHKNSSAADLITS